MDKQIEVLENNQQQIGTIISNIIQNESTGSNPNANLK